MSLIAVRPHPTLPRVQRHTMHARCGREARPVTAFQSAASVFEREARPVSGSPVPAWAPRMAAALRQCDEAGRVYADVLADTSSTTGARQHAHGQLKQALWGLGNVLGRWKQGGYGTPPPPALQPTLDLIRDVRALCNQELRAAPPPGAAAGSRAGVLEALLPRIVALHGTLPKAQAWLEEVEPIIYAIQDAETRWQQLPQARGFADRLQVSCTLFELLEHAGSHPFPDPEWEAIRQALRDYAQARSWEFDGWPA